MQAFKSTVAWASKAQQQEFNRRCDLSHGGLANLARSKGVTLRIAEFLNARPIRYYIMKGGMSDGKTYYSEECRKQLLTLIRENE